MAVSTTADHEVSPPNERPDGTDEEKIEEILDYKMETTPSQGKYGGPQQNWTDLPPPNSCKVSLPYHNIDNKLH